MPQTDRERPESPGRVGKALAASSVRLAACRELEEKIWSVYANSELPG